MGRWWLVDRRIGQRVGAADRRRILPVDLRTRLRVSADGEIVEDSGQRFRRQVLVIVGIDLHHRGVDAGAETLDFGPGERTVPGGFVLMADGLVQHFLQRIGTAQHARRGAAELHVEAPDRRQIEHGVEGRDFEYADLGHAKKLGRRFDGLLRQPAAALLLRAPQNRDYGGSLTPGRIFGDARLGPLQILRREGEARRLLFGEAADGHRSTSPNTTSSEPRIAEMSASMWPRERKSMAWRCA